MSQCHTTLGDRVSANERTVLLTSDQSQASTARSPIVSAPVSHVTVSLMGGSTQEATWCREITRLSGPVMDPSGGENQEMLQVYHSFARDSQITM